MSELISFVPVKSTQIKEIGFDKNNDMLFIRFRNKKMYRYQPVTLVEYNEFKNAESLGKHFHQHIKQRVVV